MVSPQDTAYAHCLKWLLLVLYCTGNTWSLKVWSAGLRAGEKFPLTCSIPTLKYLPHWQATGNPITRGRVVFHLKLLSATVIHLTVSHAWDGCLHLLTTPVLLMKCGLGCSVLCSAYFFDLMLSSMIKSSPLNSRHTIGSSERNERHPWIVASV